MPLNLYHSQASVETSLDAARTSARATNTDSVVVADKHTMALWFMLVTILCGCVRHPSSSTLFRVSENKKSGYVDTAGKYVITPRFQWAGDFSEGLASAMDETHKWGYVNPKGSFVIPPRFVGAAEFSEGLAMVSMDDDDGNLKIGFIDTLGRFRIPLKFIFPDSPTTKFSEGLAAVKLNEIAKPVFINKQGKVVLQPDADFVSPFHGGLAAAEQNGKSGYLDHAGEWAVSPRFESAGDFSEGVAPVEVEHHKWGYIDKTGRLVLPALYYFAGPFSEALAHVSDGVLEGYIDREGKLVISYQFEWAGPFHGGLAAVGGLRGAGLIGRNGRYTAGPFIEREYQ
jgi:hypothetical protein